MESPCGWRKILESAGRFLRMQWRPAPWEDAECVEIDAGRKSNVPNDSKSDHGVRSLVEKSPSPIAGQGCISVSFRNEKRFARPRSRSMEFQINLQHPPCLRMKRKSRSSFRPFCDLATKGDVRVNDRTRPNVSDLKGQRLRYSQAGDVEG